MQIYKKLQYSQTTQSLVQADVDLGHQLSAGRAVENNGAIFYCALHFTV